MAKSCSPKRISTIMRITNLPASASNGMTSLGTDIARPSEWVSLSSEVEASMLIRGLDWKEMSDVVGFGWSLKPPILARPSRKGELARERVEEIVSSNDRKPSDRSDISVRIKTSAGTYIGFVTLPEFKKRLSDVLNDKRPFVLLREVEVLETGQGVPFLAVQKSTIEVVEEVDLSTPSSSAVPQPTSADSYCLRDEQLVGDVRDLLRFAPCGLEYDEFAFEVMLAHDDGILGIEKPLPVLLIITQRMA